MRIIYMGTPEFAIAPLKAILDHGYNVAAVITAPDKPAGRGKKLTPSPIKEFSLAHNLNILQPEKLKDPVFINEVKNLNPDIQIVVAFRMLPQDLWSLPKYGTFNLHASLLPQYRGAAPINWAIINGEPVTGLTTFLIDEKIDTGEILLQKQLKIGQNETAGELHDRMMKEGSILVMETIEGIREGKLKYMSQKHMTGDETSLKAAPKIFKEDCMINWSSNTSSIHNLIRGLSPYPGAISTLCTDKSDLNIKIFQSQPEISKHNHNPGTIISDDKTYMKVATSDGFIFIKEIQLPGKKRLLIKEFLLGFKDISNYHLN